MRCAGGLGRLRSSTRLTLGLYHRMIMHRPGAARLVDWGLKPLCCPLPDREREMIHSILQSRHRAATIGASALGLALLVVGVPATSLAAAPPSRLPRVVGTCARSVISKVSQRLMDGETRRVIPGSGSAVDMANGVYGVSYEQVGAVNRSRRGDPVLTCLVKVPRGCPPGDDRGRLYTTTNLRTEESWTLPDAEHMCGGA